MNHSTRRKFLQYSTLTGLAMSTALYSQAATREKYRVGIIGCTGKGDYGHGLDRVWSGVARTEVVAVADENPAGLESAKMTTGAKRGYADYRKMLANEALDIVAVAPRLDLHRDMVLACAEHGRHVYMEKPFVQNLEQADDVVLACEKSGIKLSIAHINRFSPIRMMCKKLIDDGEIGEVLEIRSRGKEDSQRGGGEDLWVLGTHMLDMMRTFAGNPITCYAVVKENGHRITKADVREDPAIGPLAGDWVQATFEFEKNGVLGHFSSRRNAAADPTRFGMQIFGTKGVIEMQSGFLKRAYILKDPTWSPGQTSREWVPITSAGIGKPEPRTDARSYGHESGILDLIDAIETDRQSISSVYDARASVEMVAGCFESHRSGKPVEFPLVNRKNPLTLLE